MLNKILFFVGGIILISGCGNNNDCPNGVNTTHPNCAGYVAPQQYYSPTPSPVPCQPGTPNCVNGYYQPAPQQACQPGTPNCINGYYQQPYQQQPYQQQPYPQPYYQQPYPYVQQQPYGYPQQRYPYGQPRYY